MTLETTDDFRLFDEPAARRRGWIGWQAWAGSALVHASIALAGVAIALTATAPVPLPTNAIEVTFSIEPSIAPAQPALEPPPQAAERQVTRVPTPEPPKTATPEAATPVPETAPDAKRVAEAEPPPLPRFRPVVSTPAPAKPAALADEPAAPAAPPRPIAEGPAAQLAPGNQTVAAAVPFRPVAGMASNHRPDYPLEARSRHQQGRVLLHVQVSASGNAMAVDVTASSGYAALDEAALAAVRNWHFVPAAQAGVPVASAVDVPIDFRIAD
ncbi:MAG TPA: TonB family protein [Candidatus Cybelea sp.]|nr:TonB family protein [Candidatus Cybelea sp.]